MKDIFMQIKQIVIKNFRGIQDEEINLKCKSAILFGINGSGKTSILYAVNLLFSRIINKIVQNKFTQNIYIKNTDINVSVK